MTRREIRTKGWVRERCATDVVMQLVESRGDVRLSCLLYSPCCPSSEVSGCGDETVREARVGPETSRATLYVRYGRDIFSCRQDLARANYAARQGWERTRDATCEALSSLISLCRESDWWSDSLGSNAPKSGRHPGTTPRKSSCKSRCQRTTKSSTTVTVSAGEWSFVP